jgi:hypothetical protein
LEGVGLCPLLFIEIEFVILYARMVRVVPVAAGYLESLFRSPPKGSNVVSGDIIALNFVGLLNKEVTAVKVVFYLLSKGGGFALFKEEVEGALFLIGAVSHSARSVDDVSHDGISCGIKHIEYLQK